MKVTLELEHHEALMILDPIQEGALEDQKTAARAKDDTGEYASIRAQVRQRIATEIVDQLFPEPNSADRA
jgi:hypothetical protein